MAIPDTAITGQTIEINDTQVQVYKKYSQGMGLGEKYDNTDENEKRRVQYYYDIE